jgi:hypothetical protein
MYSVLGLLSSLTTTLGFSASDEAQTLKVALNGEDLYGLASMIDLELPPPHFSKLIRAGEFSFFFIIS